MTSFVLETGLIIVVLYALALVNLSVMPDNPSGKALTLNGLVFLLCLIGTRRAILGETSTLKREVTVLAFVSLLSAALVLAGLMAMRSLSPSPVLFIVEALFAVPLTAAGWRWFAMRYQILDGYRERVLVVGTGETAKQVARWIGEQPHGLYRVVAFAGEDGALLGQVIAMGARVLTKFGEMQEWSTGRVDRIVVALDEKRGKLPVQELMQLRLSGFEIEDATSFFERASGKLAIETMLPSWLIFSDGCKVSPVRRSAKRAADVFISLLLLILTAPIMALTALCIVLETGRPILYRQRRVGLRGIEFDMLKFRSMVHDAETKSGPTWAGQNDPRITRVGRILRKVRIDELPQLINVLRGEMSFVGPRPERPHFVQQLEKEIQYYSLRTTVRPGITGWAQVQYRYGATVEDAREKLKYDLFYIKNSNPLYDLWIMIKTIRVVITASGAR